MSKIIFKTSVVTDYTTHPHSCTDNTATMAFLAGLNQDECPKVALLFVTTCRDRSQSSVFFNLQAELQ